MQGLLSSPCPPAPCWATWLERHLAGLGLALLLAGILFFFAYNWNQLGLVLRFALVQALFCCAALAATLTCARRERVSQLAGLAAALLSGVFWAVFGQIYQTGADAWQLFALWSLFLVPWLVLRPSLPLWLLFVLVANMALGLWLHQQHGLRAQALFAFLPFQALNGLALLSCLVAVFRKPKNFHGWGYAPLSLFLAYACFMLCYCLIREVPLFSLAPLLALGSLLLALFPAIKRRCAPSLYMLSLCGFPLLNIALFRLFPARYFWRGGLSEWTAGATIFAIVNIAYVLLLAKCLPRVSLNIPFPRPEIRTTGQKSPLRRAFSIKSSWAWVP